MLKYFQIKKLFYLSFVFLLASACSYKKNLTAENIKLLPYYGSNMVFQQGKPIIIKGKSGANEVVGVRIENILKTANSDLNGNWEITFPPIDYKGNFNVYVEGKSEQLALKNVAVGKLIVLIGDSWLEDSKESFLQESYKSTSKPDIRYLQPENIRGLNADKKIRWKTLSPGNIKLYEQYVYQLGEELSENIEIPLGIINFCIPGYHFEDLLNATDSLNDNSITETEYDSLLNDFYTQEEVYNKIADSSFKGIERGVLDSRTDDFEWSELNFPASFGQRWYLKDRIVWLRKNFYVSSKYLTGNFTAYLGTLRGDFIFYLNGQQINSFSGEASDYNLELPDSLLKVWSNLLTIRMVTGDSLSGIYDDNQLVYNSDSGYKYSINSGWKFRTYYEPALPVIRRENNIYPRARENLFKYFDPETADVLIVLGGYSMYAGLNEAQISEGLSFINKAFEPEKSYLYLLPQISYVDSLMRDEIFVQKQTELLRMSAESGFKVINISDLPYPNKQGLYYSEYVKRFAKLFAE
ncbi:MAG: hypothetical protein JXA77_14380 [Bacteroidales bacterium]|nr:hypothetical protein [Bacteroidales bacterium]MBN2821186.1 hypothetical protein [Bacteroidales bacterium]